MKKIFFTLLLFCIAGLYSCRKGNDDIDVKTYDAQQMQAYISSNGLTGFQRDLTGGDTTGIYYKILTPGTGKVVDYPDQVGLVFTVRSFDGGFVTTDTIANHVYNYVGHLTRNNLPYGVELGIINILKNKGGRMRLLVPSRMGYGTSGITFPNSTSRIKGNQGLDYYINMINDDTVTDPVTGKPVNGQDLYDQTVINNYIKANNLVGYTKTASGLWYKITLSAPGAPIGPASVVTLQYTGILLNGYITLDQFNSEDPSVGTTIDLSSETSSGLFEGLQLATPGSKLSLIMPSRMAYGTATSPFDGAIPPNSCMRYDINILSAQ